MDIIYQDPGGIGYHPVMYMVRLAEELFAANLFLYPKSQNPHPISKLTQFLPSKKGQDCCLVICASPACLQSLCLIPHWRKRYRHVVAWVFDSFWVNAIPRIGQGWPHHFDHIFVTEPEDVDEWGVKTGIPTSWLPWGTDALRLGSSNGNRPVDLLRIGRQPQQWEEDEKTRIMCNLRDIKFHGRPDFFGDAQKNQRHLMTEVFARTKFSLSWSNGVSPALQTHPKREYITARWTDALAAGATVAGIAPRTEAIKELFWPGALLELSETGLEQGLVEIQQALQSWSPNRAITNARYALERLDWRWRFKNIAKKLEHVAQPLENELIEIQDIVNRMTQK
jgi:hypothetical protein